VNAASCSSSDVQAAINSASAGDTVNIPGGTCTWSSAVTIPATKGLTLNGGGTTTITGTMTLNANNTLGTRVTGFTLRSVRAITVGGSKTTAAYRIDHNTFTSGDVSVECWGYGPGLIDHNTFNSVAPPNEFIHNMGGGAGDTSGWTDDVTPGSPAMLYIEDNSFTFDATTYNGAGNTAYFWGASATQSYYGARTVFRYNTCHMCQIDQHGTAGNVGARWWEIYGNTFDTGIPLANQSAYVVIRAGSGVIFDNHHTGANSGAGSISLYEEDSGYPALYEAGRGINQNYSPAYIWGNDSNMGPGSGSTNVKPGVDFFVSATQPSQMIRCQQAADGGTPPSMGSGNTGTCPKTYSYTPFTYPYPLTSTGLPTATGGGPTDTQAPTAPTNLTASAVSSSQINLSWAASTDNVSVTGYRVYRNSVSIGTAAGSNYSDTGLAASTTYTYSVSAFDAAGNSSAQSATARATTAAAASGGSTFPVSSRSVDWTRVGIPGGIPSASWPVYRTLSPSGTADDSVAIQNAINAAPAGSVVMLNPGTYKLHRSSTICQGLADDYASGAFEAGLCLNKAVVLRGSGPTQTILQYGDGANIISLGKTYLSNSQVTFIPITAGAAKGSTQVTLQSTTGVTAGSYMVITQTNPLDSDGNPLVDISGYTGSCSACGHNLPNNVMSQIVRVTAVNGNVITTERPLYIDYTNSPQAYKLPMVENAGLENLRLQPTASSGTGVVFKNINLEACGRCWVTNVQSDMSVDRSHIYLSDVYGSEISNNYLNDGYSHNSGETYAVYLEFRASENLIQNNIIRKARHSTVMSGGSGNVFGYNYLVDAYMGEYPNSLAEKMTHAPHPYMNLWEGNVAPNVSFDFAHGSGSHNTVFRNYINLTATNPSTGTAQTSGVFAVNVAYFNNYETIVGNVLGQFGSSCTAGTYEVDADAAQPSVIYRVGYYDDGGATTPNAALSVKAGQTLLRGGNWDCKTNSVVWNTNVPTGGGASATYLSQQTLPASLYLSSAPSWLAAGGVVWPPIDPNATTKVNRIPAQVCYENGPKSGGVFNPAACYTSSGGQGLASPTNVTASVR
jgi:hypothetical protein